MITLPVWDASGGRGGAVAVLVACAVAWWLNRRLIRLYAAVTPNTEVDVEKGTVAEQKEALRRPQPTILIVWAAVMLPLTIGAWCLPNVIWPRTKDLSSFQRVTLLFNGINPVLASIQALLCSWVLSRPYTAAAAENFRVYMRRAMISAAAMAPLYVVWAGWVFSERVYGSTLVLGGAVAYALQGCVWMYFVRRSKRESEEEVGAVVVQESEK